MKLSAFVKDRKLFVKLTIVCKVQAEIFNLKNKHHFERINQFISFFPLSQAVFSQFLKLQGPAHQFEQVVNEKNYLSER